VNIDPGRVVGILLTLELQGLVRQEAGKLFHRSDDACWASGQETNNRS
jgi:hypothetical protein